MAENLHRAIGGLSLDDEDPIVLPDNPKFKVFDENATSLMGRLLNPDCQPMARMIEYMPRAWRVFDRVRGIALSRDRFQFVFQKEEDLLTVLKDRPWSYNHWTMVLERWTPNPPPDFLSSFEVWIRIKHIPINYYTVETMFELAKAIGHVEEIAYDPKVSQKTEYVRARVTFDASKPAREARNLSLPTGETVLIEYDYEKLHKKCFHCFRLTHEKAMCPMVRKPSGYGKASMQRKGADLQRTDVNTAGPSQQVPSTAKSPTKGNITSGPSQLLLAGPPGFPPLFPELSKQDQVMAMQYISHANETERRARIGRVRQAIEDSASESSAHQTKISHDLNKNKGHVFGYNETQEQPKRAHTKPSLSAPTQAGSNSLDGEVVSSCNLSVPLPDMVSTGFSMGSSCGTSYTGNLKSGKKSRKRPPSWKRHPRTNIKDSGNDEVRVEIAPPPDGSAKRKSAAELTVPINKTPKTNNET
ncbi:hypothetical protein EUTSA_v10009818mg, partial [Eutrema salsugineum]